MLKDLPVLYSSFIAIVIILKRLLVIFIQRLQEHQLVHQSIFKINPKWTEEYFFVHEKQSIQSYEAEGTWEQSK